MAEAGVDISGHVSKTVADLGDIEIDYVVTVCGDAREMCPVFPGQATVIHKGFDDPPKLAEGATTEEEALGHPMRNFVECCIGGDAPVPDMSITRMKPLQSGDVLLACSDGLWSGISDDQMSEMATRQGLSLAENLKALSMVALSANAPYSDNTTGTALRWISA